MFPQTFIGTLQKSSRKGGWTYLVWPESRSFLQTGGAVKVSGHIDGQPFESCFMPMGDGNHMLPVKAGIRKVIHKDVGDSVKVILEARR